MRLSGINHEGIELAKAMRRQSVCMFDRAKKGANLDEFMIVKNIGQGACGKVFLVQHQTTGSLYAMKAIRKDLVIDTDQLKNLYTEKNILQTADSPFLINMDFVFQDGYRIYFLMKFIKGGMLFSHLQNKDGAFSEKQVKFFILQVALGLGHLHSKEIVYRDLKPENVLIGEDGYLLVCDFGIAKLISGDEVAHTRIGTTEYMAPEILKGRAYGLTVDWWALGTLLYELLIGIPPFYHHNHHKMEKLIVSKKKKVPFENIEKMGIKISENAKDIINKLLNKDPTIRLGTKGGIDEILKHPWFSDVDIQAVIDKKVPSPYIPKVKTDAELVADAVKTKV
jgi:serum/glucocorticoid-regulated kinase 2